MKEKSCMYPSKMVQQHVLNMQALRSVLTRSGFSVAIFGAKLDACKVKYEVE